MKTTQTKKELAASVVKEKVARPERLTLSESRNMIYEKFRRNLCILRAAHDISGVDFAREIGCHSGKRIHDLESGRGVPTIEEVLVIVQYFKITMDDLLNKNAHITFE